MPDLCHVHSRSNLVRSKLTFLPDGLLDFTPKLKYWYEPPMPRAASI